MTDPSVDALRRRLIEISDTLPFPVRTRAMMGSFIGYADELPFVSLSPGGFGIKVEGAERDELLARPGAQPMRHTPTDPPSKTYVTLAPSDIDDDELLQLWLTRAGRSARHRAAKKPRRSATDPSKR
ncbi:TfoX/Sxy family protein [Microbacterium sp. P03]|uniref:TfoX/Sxy family protein n=1 Tax=Microbacterium sp. P03 TaxID=3366946 RepID=UPI003745FD7E